MGIAFGISRPPLREALKALTLMGVLESRQGGRYTVTDLSPSRLVAPFNIMLSVGDYDVHEQFEARTVVDLELVRLCAERAGAGAAAAHPEARRRRSRLRARSGRLSPARYRIPPGASTTAAGNRLLAALAQGLYDVGLDVRRMASEVPGVIEKSVEQHSRWPKR